MANKPLPNSLPADLPEDWQYNQIVAPAGADVGLSAQHGYNYLMEQVNTVQEAVNQINNAFANLASLSADGKIPLEQLVVDTALSATSGNPVQNKVVQEALAGKSPVGHTHLYAGSSSAGGAANTAAKLQTPRSVHVNLGSTGAVNFDGSGNISPGVQGILGIGNGGTGANDAAAARNNLGITAANLGLTDIKISYGQFTKTGSAGAGNIDFVLPTGFCPKLFVMTLKSNDSETIYFACYVVNTYGAGKTFNIPINNSSNGTYPFTFNADNVVITLPISINVGNIYSWFAIA